MVFFKRKARDKPQDRTAGSSYSYFMGSSNAGKSVTERSAMQMTAVYSCVRILAEVVEKLFLVELSKAETQSLNSIVYEDGKKSVEKYNMHRKSFVVNDVFKDILHLLMISILAFNTET